jgi:hypothetical protein
MVLSGNMAWSELRSCLNFIFPNSSTAETMRKMAVKKSRFITKCCNTLWGGLQFEMIQQVVLTVITVLWKGQHRYVLFYTILKDMYQHLTFNHKICKKYWLEGA